MQQSELQCLNCARPESQVPLVTLHFQSRTLHICPQCLPALIHHPEQLAAKLPVIPQPPLKTA
jgi:hypothetical protein